MLPLKRIVLVAILFFPIISQSQEADVQAGKNLFNANCAACHRLDKKAVGPALSGVQINMIRSGFIIGYEMDLK